MANPYNMKDYKPVTSYQIDVSQSEKTLGGKNATKINQHTASPNFPGGMVIADKNTELTFKVTNNMPEATNVHWHGLEIPNSQDGPNIVIEPNTSVDFKFNHPEAGTYWYHPHLIPALPQLNSGLYAPFIIKEDYDDQYAGDYVLMLDDWALSPEGVIDDQYSTSDMEVIGNVETVNFQTGSNIAPIIIKKGEIIKLRFINASTAQPHTPTLKDNEMGVTHLDGFSLPEPYMAASIRLAPSERVDVEIKGIKEEGTYEITNERNLGIKIPVIYNGSRTDMQSPFVPAPSRGFADIESKKVDFEFELNSTGMMEGMSMGGMKMDGSDETKWTINGKSFPDTDPVSLKVGEVYKLRFKNNDMMQMMDGMTHPIHIHGTHFQVVSINGKAPSQELFKDTVEVNMGEYVDIALKYKYPGEWMLHCHIIDHEDSGMMMLLNVE